MTIGAREYRFDDAAAFGSPLNWEAGIGEADNPPSEVRIIPITPELIAEDRAKQEARENPVHAWSLKSELSAENLKRVRPVKSVAKKAAKCKPPVLPPQTVTQADPVPAFQETLKSEVVEAPIAEIAKTAAAVETDPGPRSCSRGCGRAISAWNKSGVCSPCQQKFGYGTEQGRQRRRERTSMYHKAQNEREGRLCAKCEKQMTVQTKGDYCSTCTPKMTKASRTVLHAKTRSEYEADQVWAAMSEEDKWAILESAMGGGGNPQPRRRGEAR